MTTPEIFAGVGLTLTIFAWLLKLTWTLAQIETKVATMWTFQMRRALSETIATGVATLNSPLLISNQSKAVLDSIKTELQKDAKEKWSHLSDVETLLVIERDYGERLLTDICVPCKISHGACLIMALAVARNVETLDIKL